jgi:hypothetical protein
MFTKKTLAAAAVALATVTAASTFTATSAEAFSRRDRIAMGIAGGVIGGLALGAAFAGRPAYAAPVYDDYAPVRRCTLVERVNHWGEVTVRRVCRMAY